MSVERFTLPSADRSGGMALAEALQRRRSVRSFAARRLSAAELSQLLWAAQGINAPRDGLRTSPSAGALYPLLVYAVTSWGLHRYDPSSHALERIETRDLRSALAAAALGQDEVAQAACVLLFTAIPKRTTRKYGERGVRYVHMEVGHAAQNALLAAAALGLAAYPVGAFDDERLTQLLDLGRGEVPLYLLPIGAPGE